MSVDAEIAVLFKTPRKEVVLSTVVDGSIMGLSMVEDADLHCWVSPTGQLEYRADARSSPLLGETSLEGRLWIGRLGRYWTPDRPNDGGQPVIYAATLRAFASLPGVAYVWYGVLSADGGCSDVQPATDEWIAAFFDAAQTA
ncbi:hypothetical protein [Janthinobacterium sp. UMAB-56]|uniref:hypothetical protein n=1 Tax=Janthinobacterium sp. UMAB-56 TaxID=1365361 RepID=UPI001C58EC52|nr:hypothetical protein [Janthinobacterium sp. UMAB-56]